MQTRNVHYSQQPDNAIITEHAGKAVIELPVDVTEITKEYEGETVKEWVADKVYYVRTISTPGLKERVEANYDAWLELASVPDPSTVTMEDLVDAINTLTDLVLGGEI